MLEWTTSGKGARLGLLVHHTDRSASGPTTATPTSAFSTRLLTAAPAKGWLVADMREDWKTVFP